MVGIGAAVGILTGFGVPLAASYQPSSDFHSKTDPALSVAVLEIPTVPPPTSYDLTRDLEVARLEARNRRLLALLSTLRKRNAEVPKPPVSQLTSQAVFGQQ